MAAIEKNILIRTRNNNGDIEIHYPITKAENIEDLKAFVETLMRDEGGGDYAVILNDPKNNTAAGRYALAAGSICEASGDYSNARGYRSIASGEAASVEGYSVSASGKYSHAEGNMTIAMEESSHAEGHKTEANGQYSHAEGYYVKAESAQSHAEGYYTIASGVASHTEGYRCEALEEASHAEGLYTNAAARGSHAEGYRTVTEGEHSHAGGYYTKTEYEYATAIGMYNRPVDYAMLMVGGGNSTARVNAFRVDDNGDTYAGKAFLSEGADYAEYFEWEDGNPDNQDRVGLFVTMNEDKIKIANENDWILGAVTGAPCIIGNADEMWQGFYVKDKFNRKIVNPEAGEMIQVVSEYNPETGEREDENVPISHPESVFLVNPDYDPELKYIPRGERCEWDTVGMKGVLTVYDDGNCSVNGYCKCGNNGIAVPSEDKTDYRVIKRIDDETIKIII